MLGLISRVTVGSDTVSSNGNFTFVLTSANTAPLIIQTWAGGSGTSLSVTNISVIEITTDTSLPRINYEGFSYQDVLGSELVVNGTFDSDTAWSKGAGWSIANGEATHTGGASYLSQSILNPNTQYKVKIKVSQASGSNFVQIYMGGSPASVLIQNVGEYEYIFTSQSSIGLGFALRGAGNVGIDNVSVKEYLGQEVVPDSGCGSWLFEPQSTNLITYSEDFSQSFWTKQASVTLDKGYLAPDGTYNATKISGVIGSSYVVSQGGILSSSSTKSIWAKTTSGTGVIHLGANQNQSNASFTVTNEWQRFEVTGTTTDVYAVDFRNASTTLSEVLVWGAQGENLSYATSYIPTNGEANGVTRNQDVCNNGGSLASINSTEGTLYAEISTLNGDSGSNRTISLSDSTNGNQIRFYFPINIESRIIIRVDVGGSTIYVFAYNIITSETPIKLAFRYSPNGMDFYVNGSLVSSSALVPSFTNNLNSLQFRRGDGQFGADFFGKTKALAVWKEALSDSELQSLTTI